MSFIDKLSTYAVKHGRKNDILPSLILAQGILESNKGASELAVNANNLFGIKKGSGWTGDTYRKKTAEQKPDGMVYYVVAEFRKYDSYEDCVIDLCDKYMNGLEWETHNRYSAVIGETDYKKATQAVYDAGYATDIEYSYKLQSVIEKYDLTQYDKGVTPLAHTIGLDYGHGSNTFPPSKGVYRKGKAYHEHDFNSKLGLEVKKILEHNGFQIVEGQKSYSPEVPLYKRINLYNSQNVDLVWSIHANAGNSAADGRCAFYWHTSQDSKTLADYYAEETRNAGYSTHGNGTHASRMGTWTELAICRDTNMNAVLTENGFMTNDDDFDLVFGSKQDQYIYDMARVHAKAICRYFGVSFKDIDNKEDELTLSQSQYEELKGKIEELEKLIKGDGTDEASDWALWDEGEELEITDGTNPRAVPTREQTVTLIVRMYNKIMKEIKKLKG